MIYAGKAHGQSTLAAASGINRWPTRHGVLEIGISPMALTRAFASRRGEPAPNKKAPRFPRGLCAPFFASASRRTPFGAGPAVYLHSKPVPLPVTKRYHSVPWEVDTAVAGHRSQINNARGSIAQASTILVDRAERDLTKMEAGE